MVTQYETHIQCDCGGTLIFLTEIGDNQFDQLMQMDELNIWRVTESITYRHRGPFTERCLEFKDEVLEIMRQDTIRRQQGLLGRFISRPLHG